MTAPGERWRAVPGWPYEAGYAGQVRRVGAARPLRPSLDKDGYQQVTLSDGGRRRTVAVHTLVALAWIGPRPKGKQVRHLDGDKLNCHAWNLKWGTWKQNEQDKSWTGTKRTGRRQDWNGTDVLIGKRELSVPRTIRTPGQ